MEREKFFALFSSTDNSSAFRSESGEAHLNTILIHISRIAETKRQSPNAEALIKILFCVFYNESHVGDTKQQKNYQQRHKRLI